MKKLLEYLESDNLADELSTETLALIAGKVIRQYNEDWDSMKDYRDVVEKGLELSKPDINPRSTPWEGSANYKSTALISACVGFGDRASLELLSKKKELFMLDIIGSDDAEKTKKLKAQRIQKYENHCIQYAMGDWIESQSKLLYTLPAYGTVFKKIFYNPMDGVKVSTTINYPNYAINQASTSLETCRAFTEKHCIALNEAEQYIRLGWWSDINLTIDNEDIDDEYLEQYCYWDMDDDGYEEPYLITVHKKTEQVCRIIAAYKLEDVIFKNGDVISNLGKAKELDAIDEVVKTGKVIKINRRMSIVKYGFIKSVDGNFLDVGHYYLLSALTALINTTTNMLLNGGALAHLPSGFLSKEHRARKGKLQFQIGEFKQTDIPAIALQNSVMKLPVSDIGQGLYLLNESAKKENADFAASLDMEGLLGSHVSATSALVASQEALIPHSAIMNSILRSQTKEFEMLYDLTPEYLTDAEYSAIIGEQASVAEDYDKSSMIKATAQSAMNNVVVEMYRKEALIGMIPTILQAGGNVIPIITDYIKEIGGTDIEAIFKPMSEEEQIAKSKEMTMQKQKESQLADLNIAIAQGQVEAFKAEQETALAKQENERAKLMQQIKVMIADEHKKYVEAAEINARAESTYIDNAQKASPKEVSNAEHEVDEHINKTE